MILGDMEALPGIFDDLRELVERESPSDDPERVSALAAWVRERLNRGEDPIARLVPCPPRGAALIATLGQDGGGRSTLLLGHIDTVWPVGTLLELPFGADGPLVRGPGVFDSTGSLAEAPPSCGVGRPMPLAAALSRLSESIRKFAEVTMRSPARTYYDVLRSKLGWGAR